MGASRAFGYVFRNLVLVGMRLQFGWRTNPGFWCLFASALEHSRLNPLYDDAVITAAGREAAAHVGVTQPADTDRPGIRLMTVLWMKCKAIVRAFGA